MVTNTEDIVARDLPQFQNILNNLKSYLSESITGVTQLHNIVSNDVSREKGLSFLEMKCHLFLEYLINITYSMLLKLDGQQLCGQPCIDNLVEIRTVLTKIKPIEKKLKYQIDKLVKMASTDLKTTEQHALSFKPNLDNLVGNDDEDSDDEENGKEEESNVYVPPKLTAVPYEGDKMSREEKRLEKARKRSLNSNLLADMREEFGDEPDEISDTRKRSIQKKLKVDADEREHFEEENLRRLTVTKKDKMMKRKLGMLDEVVKIGNFSSVGNEESDDLEPLPKSKKSKSKKTGSGKGKFKKRMQRKRK